MKRVVRQGRGETSFTENRSDRSDGLWWLRESGLRVDTVPVTLHFRCPKWRGPVGTRMRSILRSGGDWDEVGFEVGQGEWVQYVFEDPKGRLRHRVCRVGVLPSKTDTGLVRPERTLAGRSATEFHHSPRHVTGTPENFGGTEDR